MEYCCINSCVPLAPTSGARKSYVVRCAGRLVARSFAESLAGLVTVMLVPVTVTVRLEPVTQERNVPAASRNNPARGNASV